MSISENLETVRRNISASCENSVRSPEEITLIAVTKTHPPELINEAIDAGVTDIGENKVQEIMDKYDKVTPGVRWHLIGHLQTNKVKYIIDKVCMIHSVDSIRLLDEIEKQAAKHNRIMDILIQINISGEETKSGIKPEELDELLEYASGLAHVKVRGLMTIGVKCYDNITNKLYFDNIYGIFIDKSLKKYDNISMDYLSMGMSGDYELAIECGSNMVRVGSAVFGKRFYDI